MIKIEGIKKNKKWYFRIKARNGRILCHSEQYNSERACSRAIDVIVDSIRAGDWIAKIEL